MAKSSLQKPSSKQPAPPAAASPTEALDQLAKASRSFKPPKEFSKKAHVGSMAEYRKMHKQSIEKPDKYWSGIASQLHWFKPWKKVLDWKLPDAKWFVG